MIYRSNLTCPDLRPHFKLLSPPKEMVGHEAPSDPDFDPNCTFWTDDEAAILYTVAKQVGGLWADIGARLGWTSAHIIKAGAKVVAVDQELKLGSAFEDRFDTNLGRFWRGLKAISCQKSQGFLLTTKYEFVGFVIDADHDEPQPLLDAVGAAAIAKPNCVILMHDFWGRPIQDAVQWLMNEGWSGRIYDTPNGVALLWRGKGFVPPDHIPDPAINWAEVRQQRAPEFPFDRTE